ncbi:unnamed protein product, partial [Closterium sp. NIES-53]
MVAYDICDYFFTGCPIHEFSDCCVLCAVCRVPCAVCRVPCAVCGVPCAVCRVPCAVCRVPCAVCRVPGAVCRVPCAVCCVLCAGAAPLLPLTHVPLTCNSVYPQLIPQGGLDWDALSAQGAVAERTRCVLVQLSCGYSLVLMLSPRLVSSCPSLCLPPPTVDRRRHPGLGCSQHTRGGGRANALCAGAAIVWVLAKRNTYSQTNRAH